MNNRVQISLSGIFSLLTGLAAFLFWQLCHPEVLSWHEQNQMFRYAADYLAQRASLPGGLSAYLADFLTQFYYYPTAGAAMLGMLYMALYQLSYRIVAEGATRKMTAAVLSLLIPALMWAAMGDEQVMLCYVISLNLTLLTALLISRCEHILCCIVLQCILYYVAGPIAILLPLLDWLSPNHRNKPILQSGFSLSLQLATMGLCLLISYHSIMPRYPWIVVGQGIFYYRTITFAHELPAILWIIPFAVFLLKGLCMRLSNRVKAEEKRGTMAVIALIIVLVSGLCIKGSFDGEKYAQLRQDYLVRGNRWQQILKDAQENQTQTEMSCTAVNLALAMTGQMPDNQFKYYQCGMKGLLIGSQRDNIQTLPTMEAFYRLGLINMAMWYAFEAQQAIPNQNQSARLTKRLAECNLIVGRYEVARKYIDLLKQTQFYSHWAYQAEQLLNNDALLARHTEYGRLRSFMLDAKFDCLMPQTEMEKVIGRLFVQNNDNTMAMHYYLSALLLKGERQEYVSYLPDQAQQMENPFPQGYKEYYIRMANQIKNGQATEMDAATGATQL